MKVLVLGAGPAGLMAAHAAAITNNDIVILSKKRKSFMRGAQYLHAPIPMVSGDPFVVNYSLQGEIEGYQEKVYKDKRVQVSPESLVGSHLAWDMREAYSRLWDLYEEDITDQKITSEELPGIISYLGADLIISSIPAPVICKNVEHTFNSTEVFVTEMFRGPSKAENVVICNGEKDLPWYRTSRIHGWENTEYPKDKKPPFSAEKVHSVQKPITTNCDCWEDIVRTGRYGTWKKGVLSHDSFYKTFTDLQNYAKLEHSQ